MSFLKQIAVTVVVIGGLAAYPLARWAGRDVLIGAIAGALLATLYVLLGWAALEYSRGKSTLTFFKVVLGGMGVRLLVMGGLTALLVTTVVSNTAAFLWSLGLFYLVYLVEEIIFITQTVESKQ